LPELVELSQLSVQYRVAKKRTVLALDKVSLDIPASGYTMGIVGESGSGKTTLGLSILNLIEPPGKITGGEVLYSGNNVLAFNKKQLRSYRWQDVAMVYQSAMNSMNPVKRVSDPIIEVLRVHAHLSRAEARDRALKLLSQVGIRAERAFDYPHELSGGMRQRVIIALAMALSPRLLIADEPTSALDVVVQQQILELLHREVSQRGLSLLFITHEISILSGLVENVAVMYAGEVVERGDLDSVLLEPLHPYTEMLLDALLTLDSTKEELVEYSKAKSRDTVLPVPEMACKYSNRCKYVFDRCRLERPELREVQKGRWVACHKY
jgi:peptide/nickel transport system ATP-binding protein